MWAKPDRLYAAPPNGPVPMAQICPKCTADTETLEEETTTFCIHEKLLMGVGVAVIAGGLVYAVL